MQEQQLDCLGNSWLKGHFPVIIFWGLKIRPCVTCVEQNLARLTGFRRWMGAQTVPESGVLFAGLLKGSTKKKKSNPKCSAEDKEKIPNLLETSELWKRRSRADVWQ